MPVKMSSFNYYYFNCCYRLRCKLSLALLLLVLLAAGEGDAAGQCLRRGANEADIVWNYDARTGRCYAPIEMRGAANFSDAQAACAALSSALTTVPLQATNSFLISPFFMASRRPPKLLMIGLRFSQGEASWDDNYYYSPEKFQSFSNATLVQSNGAAIASDYFIDDLCTVILYDPSSASENGKWGRVGCSLPLPAPVAICSRLADESDVCPPGTRLLRYSNSRKTKCELCPLNTFQPDFNKENCRQCPGPAMQGYFIDTRMPGATAQVQCYRPLPALVDFQPKFGIQAGGTIIKVDGQHFFISKNFLVLFNNQPGELIDSTSNSLTIRAPPLNVSDPTIVFLPNSTDAVATFQLLFNDDIFIVEYFTYKPNPIVHGFTPGAFIAGGGQNITVSGENLDGADDITLIVELSNSTGEDLGVADDGTPHSSTIQIKVDCDPQNSTLMTCRLPDFYSLLPGLTRRQSPVSSLFANDRQQQPQSQPAPTIGNNQLRKRSAAADSRRDPSVCSPALSSPSPSSPAWRTSFVFTFEDKYTTKAEASPSDVIIYDDPTIDKWSADQIVSPNSNETLTITGKGLACGLAEDDYSVSVGGQQQRRCDIVELNMTAITCVPQLDSLSSRSALRLPVQVRIGSKTPFPVGFLLRTAVTTTTTTTTTVAPTTTAAITVGKPLATNAPRLPTRRTTTERSDETQPSAASLTTEPVGNTTMRSTTTSPVSAAAVDTTATSSTSSAGNDTTSGATTVPSSSTTIPPAAGSMMTTKQEATTMAPTSPGSISTLVPAPGATTVPAAGPATSTMATTQNPTASPTVASSSSPTTVGPTVGVPAPSTPVNLTPAPAVVVPSQPSQPTQPTPPPTPSPTIRPPGVLPPGQIDISSVPVAPPLTVARPVMTTTTASSDDDDDYEDDDDAAASVGKDSKLSAAAKFDQKEAERQASVRVFIGVIVGVGVAVVIIIITIIVVCCLWCRRKKRRKAASEMKASPTAVEVVSATPLTVPTTSMEPMPAPRGSVHTEGLSQHGSMEIHNGFIVVGHHGSTSTADSSGNDEHALREGNALLSELPERLRAKCVAILISSGRIKVASTFLRGNFGELAFGYWAPSLDRSVQAEPVMIKSLNRFMQRSNIVRKFLDDALLLQKCDHENVLAPIAVAFRRARPLVLYPHVDGVNLKIYLTDESVPVLVRQLVDIASQVASAMAYLSETSGFNIIHKDIAARNCILAPDENYLLKLTDSALVGDMHGLDYEFIEEAHDFLPVRWMAPESLLRLEYSTKSDAWAFGVLIWELFTRGQKPFQDIHSVEVATELRERARGWLARSSITVEETASIASANTNTNNRSSSLSAAAPIFPRPSQIPDEIYSLINRCCQAKSQDRPSFSVLNQELTKLLDDNEEKPPYMKPVVPEAPPVPVHQST